MVHLFGTVFQLQFQASEFDYQDFRESASLYACLQHLLLFYALFVERRNL